ncbi:MAG: PAS domain S-box protein, partial [Chitinophagaceae bacterium]
MEIKSTKEYSFYKALLEASPDAMLIVDAHGIILHTNSQTEILFGYKKNELDGKSIELLITAALHETYLKYRENYLKNPNVRSMGTVPDLEVIKKDSTKFSVEVSLSPLQTDEGILILISIRNITDRKKTDEKLFTSELRYRRLFETAQDGILILDADTGKIEDVNPFLMKLLSFKYPEFIGKQLWEIGFFKDIIANKACFLKLQQEGYVRYENLPLENKGGRPIWVEFVSNVYNVNGKKVVQCNIRDITDRKLAEEKLKQLLQAVEQSPASVIITGIDGNIQYVNKKFMAVSGYELAEVLGKNPRILKSSHTSETDYAYLWNSISSGQEWNGEFHNKKKNGEFYWEKALISPIFDSKRKIINYLA